MLFLLLLLLLVLVPVLVLVLMLLLVLAFAVVARTNAIARTDVVAGAIACAVVDRAGAIARTNAIARTDVVAGAIAGTIACAVVDRAGAIACASVAAVARAGAIARASVAAVVVALAGAGVATVVRVSVVAGAVAGTVAVSCFLLLGCSCSCCWCCCCWCCSCCCCCFLFPVAGCCWCCSCCWCCCCCLSCSSPLRFLLNCHFFSWSALLVLVQRDTITYNASAVGRVERNTVKYSAAFSACSSWSWAAKHHHVHRKRLREAGTAVIIARKLSAKKAYIHTHGIASCVCIYAFLALSFLARQAVRGVVGSETPSRTVQRSPEQGNQVPRQATHAHQEASSVRVLLVLVLGFLERQGGL